MALVDNSLICWRMAGWEKISAALSQLRTMNRIAGTSQLATDGAAVLTSLKTSRSSVVRPVKLRALSAHRTAQVLAEWIPRLIKS
jgi:hypothetical protein